ncbi:threo-3-hydroxy-L-aspartate ammonia-lyase [Leekyejoonella antrihumi]|uniref:threonine ammonia-lyase n=1 Tax=Leekyejoonella antrihumi TaxID=1660198 RepID=A0A563E8P6_9MICO|nr:threo-3-hydroxy-L-aspartate ammonia-lyase [Leekyejoonella antrihumi]TWP38948.1 threo-3-hydroxy-L-aspartate ammonia-lyase [Leekyejoonella antrihumi]
MTRIPTLADVEQAARRIAGVAHRTPVLTSSRINGELGCSIYFKCENLQRAGAFKFRGAYNALSGLPESERTRGVVAFSSGNHAQAVALAAHLLGMPATIVMPSDAPGTKLSATRGYGAQVVPYDRASEDREAIAREVAERTGAILLPPFNHPAIIAGQGTSALELIDEVPELDLILSPLGGGGLTSGTAIVAAAHGTAVIGVEPAAGDDAKQSLASGHIVTIPTPETLADGARTTAIGDLPFAIMSELVETVWLATDDQLVEAMRSLAQTMKLVVEPTGALGYAAARHGAARLAGKRVGVILSGGNVDLTAFGRLIA